MGGTCGALGWERGERRHKRKGLGGTCGALGWERAWGERLTDGPPNLKRASDRGVCVCLCEGAALLREFLPRARDKG